MSALPKSSIPSGYVGHERDLLKGQCVPDPNIRFDGPANKVRVFLRATRDYAVCIDHGEDFPGAERYETIVLRPTLYTARTAGERLALGRDP